MSGSEIQLLEVGNAPHTMTVERYDEERYYSSYWPADSDYDVLLEFSEYHPPSEDASATVQVPSQPKIQVDYEVVEKHLSPDIELLRIDDHGYAMTWQRLEVEMNRVGFISTEPNVNLITDLYHQSTETDLSESDQEELNEFVSNF